MQLKWKLGGEILKVLPSASKGRTRWLHQNLRAKNTWKGVKRTWTIQMELHRTWPNKEQLGISDRKIQTNLLKSAPLKERETFWVGRICICFVHSKKNCSKWNPLRWMPHFEIFVKTFTTATRELLMEFPIFTPSTSGPFKLLLRWNIIERRPEIRGIRRKTNPRWSLVIYVNHRTNMNNGKSQKFPMLLVYDDEVSTWIFLNIWKRFRVKSFVISFTLIVAVELKRFYMKLTLEVIEERLDKMQQAEDLSSMVETKSVPTMKVPADLMLVAFWCWRCYSSKMSWLGSNCLPITPTLISAWSATENVSIEFFPRRLPLW